eukprot:1802040-Pyramimonas_sp.AAC.1
MFFHTLNAQPNFSHKPLSLATMPENVGKSGATESKLPTSPWELALRDGPLARHAALALELL